MLMKADTGIETSFFVKRRTWFLLAGLVLFLPPLSLLFQFTQDSSFCGAWCPRMFFVWRPGTTLDSFTAGLLRSFMGAGLVSAVLISTFFLGRFWCSHLCPVGGTAELGSRLIPERLKARFASVPAAPVRYGYLTAYFALPILGLGSLCCGYCNFATVPRLFGAAFSQADLAYFFRTAGLVNLGLLLVLGFFAKGGRAYCNFLCPVGALDALSGRLGERFGKRMRIAGERCNGCARCREVCPLWAIRVDEKAEIDHLSCIPCGRCAGACPENAVVYGRRKAFQPAALPVPVQTWAEGGLRE